MTRHGNIKGQYNFAGFFYLKLMTFLAFYS
nr:MAG TPA: hypothetical protein [Caudoviricetes sp.]